MVKTPLQSVYSLIRSLEIAHSSFMSKINLEKEFTKTHMAYFLVSRSLLEFVYGLFLRQ